MYWYICLICILLRTAQLLACYKTYHTTIIYKFGSTRSYYEITCDNNRHRLYKRVMFQPLARILFSHVRNEDRRIINKENSVLGVEILHVWIAVNLCMYNPNKSKLFNLYNNNCMIRLTKCKRLIKGVLIQQVWKNLYHNNFQTYLYVRK